MGLVGQFISVSKITHRNFANVLCGSLKRNVIREGKACRVRNRSIGKEKPPPPWKSTLKTLLRFTSNSVSRVRQVLYYAAVCNSDHHSATGTWVSVPVYNIYSLYQ